MDTLTQRILELSGPMPDAAAHARYLQTLTTAQLKERLATLLLDSTRPEAPRVEFWRPKLPAAAGERQTTLAIC